MISIVKPSFVLGNIVNAIKLAGYSLPAVKILKTIKTLLRGYTR